MQEKSNFSNPSSSGWSPKKNSSWYDENDRSLPRASDSEQALLGAALCSNSVHVFDSISDILSPSDFFYSFNQHVYSVICDLIRAGHAPDTATVIDRLKDRVDFDESHRDYLADLIRNAPSATNFRLYAESIKSKSKLRSALFVANEIQSEVRSGNPVKIADLIEKASAQFDAINQENNVKSGPKKASDVASATVDWLTDSIEKAGDLLGLPTGFNDLDKLTSGLQNSDLIIVAGRPSMGKTAFAMNIAEYATCRLNKCIVVFSIEMTAVQLMLRMICSLGNVDMMKIRNGQLSNEDWQRITASIATISQSRLYIDETPGISPSAVRLALKKVEKEEGKIDGVVVDYLQLMQIYGSKEKLSGQVSEISRSLKSIAKEFDTPVIALSQLNRSVESRVNKRPMMSDIRESGAIEQDADLILFVYRDEFYNHDTPHKGMAEIIIGKQRNGPTDTVNLIFKGKNTRFENMINSFNEEINADFGNGATNRFN
jgi:replicative DNA helicase